jgi:hypothetical protein
MKQSKLSDYLFRRVESFRIIDDRYRPVEKTAYTPTEVKMAHQVSSAFHAEWYDYEQQKAMALPPVGTECEFKCADGFIKGLVESLSFSGVYFSHTNHEFGNPVYSISAEQFFNFRPLDWQTRTKDLEKERVVDAFMANVWQFSKSKCTFESAKILLGDAYDKGFLKLPD